MSASTLSDRRENPYDAEWNQFRTATASHELTVYRDDGLSRHLRVHSPGTRTWSWDVITWPGYLATYGDVADDYMFTRQSDMMTFFATEDWARHYFSDDAPCLDVRYWAEKLCGHQHQLLRRYDSRAFMDQVEQALAEQPFIDSDTRDLALGEARRAAENKADARDWLIDDEELVGDTVWEWDLSRYTTDFLITCYAIDLTVQLYQQWDTDQLD